MSQYATMGEFTQNLLKLTDYPFSYSLISLLALMVGYGDKPDEFSFDVIGPLFVLMGFVATTLSICDPIGVLQRTLLKSTTSYILVRSLDDLLFGTKIFGITAAKILNPLYYIIFTYGREIIDDSKINIDLLHRYSNNQTSEIAQELNKINLQKSPIKVQFVTGIKNKTIRSKWIAAEMDRITALIYFMIVISVFLIAIIYLPDFLQIFVHSFNDNASIYAGLMIFVSLALAGISYMCYVRIRALQSKAAIVFRYLTALEAIRNNEKDFNDTLDDIERYLDSNDWILVEYWLDRLEIDYVERILDSQSPKKTRNLV